MSLFSDETSPNQCESSFSNSSIVHYRAVIASSLDMEDAIMIAVIANKHRLFMEIVTPQIIFDLFNESLKEPIAARNISGICYLFYSLSEKNLIGFCWQTALCLKGSILLHDRSKPQTPTALSSAVTRGRSKKHSFTADIDKLVRQILQRHEQE